MNTPAASLTCPTTGLGVIECSCPHHLAALCMCSACRPQLSADTQPKENT